jgi:hypothetical protein
MMGSDKSNDPRDGTASNRHSDLGLMVDMEDNDLTDAAQDMLDAIRDRDAKALGLAAQRLVECCSSEPDEDDSEE